MAYSSLLCLGDSYTIGEGLPLYESFPYQTVQLLRAAGKPFFAPEILARTGWTTDELAAAIGRTSWLPGYDYATLLIGANNQYRGRGVQEYAVQFGQLLQKACGLAGRVFVLSVPDWSVSPFGQDQLSGPKGRSMANVRAEIDAFNAAAAGIAAGRGIPFIDITAHGRDLGAEGGDPAGDSEPGTKDRKPRSKGGLFTADGLHPSGEQYRFWAGTLSGLILGTADARINDDQ